MDLLLNDLSLHEQFRDISTFSEAIEQIMSLRRLAKRFGFQVHTSKRIYKRCVTPTVSLTLALQKLPKDQERSMKRWLEKRGPFWDEKGGHSPNLYMSLDGEVVTETAVGEAAHSNLVGIDRALVSFRPSTWEYCPLTVTVDPDSQSETNVTVYNYWQNPELEAALLDAEPPIATWAQLESKSRTVFQRLLLSADCFESLKGQPFAPSAANRILVLLGVLDQLMGAVDASGRRNAEGHRLYQDHFTGDKALFTDSSDSEKRRFKEKLTFVDPHGTRVFCTWHGKVNNPKIRIHFAWPVPPGNPVFVPYIGLKIARR